jgi:hypothetical protein
MADQPRTQKQVAQKYKDNLDYYRHGHFLRRTKLILFVLAIFGSLCAVFGFRYWGNKEYFSTGPISQNHARFANDCAQCHEGAEADLSRALKLDQAITDLKEGKLPSLDLDKLKSVATDGAKKLSPEELKAAAERNLSPEKFSALKQAVIKKSSLVAMDRACLRCHDPFKLHQPQSEALALRGVHPELPLVHADRCSTCHREHVGVGRMMFPGSETCTSCHGDPKELKRTRNVIQVASPNPPQKPENRDLGDGLIRFIMPQEANAQPAVIFRYDLGHPPFRYQFPNARDPAVIRYNHQRHEQADIPKLNGHILDCADCHVPKPGGAYYERVKFEKHCAQCHSLNIVPELPDFKIPHGDPATVRVFISSMNRQLAAHLTAQNPNLSEADIAAKVIDIVNRVRERGNSTFEEFERRVFETGDPPKALTRLSPTNDRQFFPACAKCHEVQPASGGAVRKVTKTNIADRWVHHGPFTHLPHRHMSCNDCHGAAHQSQSTADILMPPQAICVECHRPLDKDRLVEGVAPKPGSPEMAAAQRRAGSVKWECQACHHFHASPEAIQLLEAKATVPSAKP